MTNDRFPVFFKQKTIYILLMSIGGSSVGKIACLRHTSAEGPGFDNSVLSSGYWSNGLCATDVLRPV